MTRSNTLKAAFVVGRQRLWIVAFELFSKTEKIYAFHNLIAFPYGKDSKTKDANFYQS